ncbi:MAG: CPBP family intramembrane metalloprotease [Cyclobacteriaceae bacterium]
MNTILQYLKKYLREHFHWKFYLSVTVFLGICIYFNYKYDFEDSILDSYHGSELKWLFMFLHMSFPFLVTCGLLYVFGIQKTWLNSKEYWIKFIVGFAIISFDRQFYYFNDFLRTLPRVDYIFAFRAINWGDSLIATVLPLMIFYYFYERTNDTERHWYGLTLKHFDFKPYIILVLLVFGGMAIASFLSELNTYYPRYKHSGGTAFADVHDIPELISVLVYELVYGSYYISVELFFRGFLVIAFARVLGGHAVIAMVGSYVFLHFGKPLPETISSAFGGYLIGILAFYTNRIWGGVILHVALAWSMELFAWLQNVYSE